MRTTACLAGVLLSSWVLLSGARFAHAQAEEKEILASDQTAELDENAKRDDDAGVVDVGEINVCTGAWEWDGNAPTPGPWGPPMNSQCADSIRIGYPCHLRCRPVYLNGTCNGQPHSYQVSNQCVETDSAGNFLAPPVPPPAPKPIPLVVCDALGQVCRSIIGLPFPGDQECIDGPTGPGPYCVWRRPDPGPRRFR